MRNPLSSCTSTPANSTLRSVANECRNPWMSLVAPRLSSHLRALLTCGASLRCAQALVPAHSHSAIASVTMIDRVPVQLVMGPLGREQHLLVCLNRRAEDRVHDIAPALPTPSLPHRARCGRYPRPA